MPHSNLPSPESSDWYLQETADVVARLGCDPRVGLTGGEARQRLEDVGPNVLQESAGRPPWSILLAQLKSSLVVLLLVAMGISLLVGETTDALAILAIVVLNSLLGFWQDYRAEQALAALQKLAVPEAAVRRDGRRENVPSSQLVPGDVLLLQAGYFVSADCRILESQELAIDESTLTGESMPVSKSVAALHTINLPLGDRRNLGFRGTMVVRGRGVAVVTATGMRTELGKIASSIQSVKPEPTPMQIRLAMMSRTLALMAVAIVAVVFFIGMLSGKEPQLMLMTALSLAVAVVPEGLPAVATVALAIGAGRMLRRQALIRQLPAVETLGSVSVICSDKTGTLTQNLMVASVLETVDQRWTIEPALADVVRQRQDLQWLYLAAALCNDAEMPAVGEGTETAAAIGEPTEVALLQAAAGVGLEQSAWEDVLPRVAEVPFSSQRKRMTTLHQCPDRFPGTLAGWELTAALTDSRLPLLALAKGAISSLLQVCSRVQTASGPVELTPERSQAILDQVDRLASQGMRVLAFAMAQLPTTPAVGELERDLTLLGWLGLMDPPRPEVAQAIALCHDAGIRSMMITGDHPATALEIARQLGIGTEGGAIDGQRLAAMSPEELRDEVLRVSVFARVAPEDKHHIVEALQFHGQVVAMTGDGVNDAPALKQADVGVAMGRVGTDVARQAADVVLLDDHFATIVAAVEQGRVVYANVEKFIRYTMSSNVGEVVVMTIALIAGWPLPLLPLQILWINLVTDGLPGLALAVEPAEPSAMRRPPISPQQAILGRAMGLHLMWVGGLIGGVSLLVGGWWGHAAEIEQWRTLVFTALTFAQMGNVLAARRRQRNWPWSPGRANRWLWAAVALTCALQMAVVYWAPLGAIFDTRPLGWLELLACAGAGVVVMLGVEATKWTDA